MADCFCGCGRKVRFTKKRLAKLGSRTQETLGALKSVTLPAVAGDPIQEPAVRKLIGDGEHIRDLYAGLIHGEVLAPPLNLQAQVFEWERDATRVAKGSLRSAGESRSR